MNITSFFGFICPTCNISVGVGVCIGVPRCSRCGNEMIPDKQGTPISINVHCSNCNIRWGMIDSDKCPKCGKKF